MVKSADYITTLNQSFDNLTAVSDLGPGPIQGTCEKSSALLICQVSFLGRSTAFVSPSDWPISYKPK